MLGDALAVAYQPARTCARRNGWGGGLGATPVSTPARLRLAQRVEQDGAIGPTPEGHARQSPGRRKTRSTGPPGALD
jgi:hypothetical protein